MPRQGLTSPPVNAGLSTSPPEAGSQTDPDNPKARTRFIRALFVAGAALLITSVFIVYQVGLMGMRAEQKMACQLRVMQQLGDFLSALENTETGQRGYLLTGEAPYLQPYEQGRSELFAKQKVLRQLGAAGDLEPDQVEQLAELVQQKLDELEQTIRLRRDQGLEAALNIVRSNLP